MLGDEDSIFFLSEERTERLDSGRPEVGFAPELTLAECRRLCLGLNCPDAQRVERASDFWRIAKGRLEEIDALSDPVGLNVILGEGASLIPRVSPEEFLVRQMEPPVRGALYIARNSIEWVDLILDASSLYTNVTTISESIDKAMRLSLQIAYTGSLVGLNEGIPWPGRFPATVADFALIGRYRNKPTAISRLREFLGESLGLKEGERLFAEWEERGVESWDWYQFAHEWKAWSEQAMKRAKNRVIDPEKKN